MTQSTPSRRTIALDSLSDAERYYLLISAIVPRPIAWVSSLSSDGQANLAPFSFFQGVSSTPPILMIAIAKTKSDGSPKDTLANIIATKEFVVGSVHQAQAPSVVASAEELDAGESEFAHAGVTTFPAIRVAPACIEGSGVNLECRLERTIAIGNSVAVFGEILLAQIDESLLDARNTVDPERLRPLARLGGSLYLPYGAAQRIRRR